MNKLEENALRANLVELKGIRQLQKGRKSFISEELTKLKKLEAEIMQLQSKRLARLSFISTIRAEYETTERRRIELLQKKHPSIAKERLVEIYQEVEGGSRCALS